MPVRGYIDSGYGIDRWFLSNTDGMILIQDDGLNITLDKRCNYSQRLPISLSGKTVTFSILAENVVGPAYISIRKYNFEWFGDGSRIPIHDGLTTITYTIPAESADNRMVCISNIDDVSQVSAKVKAVKLELGPTQTLAHQENEQWVLNEIPDYGEQLAKCQRYYYKPYHVLLWRTPGTNSLTVDVNFKVDMRAIPVAIYTNPLIVLVPGKTPNGSIALSNLVINVDGAGNCDLTSVDPSDAEVLQVERAQIAFSADL